MERLRQYIQWRRFSGKSVARDDVVVTPESQALIVRFPFGGFVWNRPVSVRVEDSNGVIQIPVPDVTRYVQWSLFAVSAILTFSVWLVRRKQ
jgi:hypothetical protein